MENNIIQKALKNYFEALKELRNLGILINSKDFTSQLGEWIVESYFKGKRAENGIQKHWDIETNIGKIQVKTHAKADKTSARWSNINKIETAEIDFVVIIVFNKDYQLKELYQAPWDIVFEKIRQHSDADRIFWDDLKKYKIALSELKENELFNCFLD